MRPTDEQKIQEVLALVDSGLSCRKIAEQVGVSHTSVARIRKERRPDAQIPKAGRPNILSDELANQVVELVSTGKIETAVEAHEIVVASTGTKLSVETIRNVLRRAGFRGSEMPSRPTGATAAKKTSKMKKPKTRGKHKKT
ncbi:hypothetical protein GQ54DRAFT_166269 [Martensiomyces pterosporus]|nr:hypothetical protein GQ54DRAFT_166269 [Martensiomyces pterosporus]